MNFTHPKRIGLILLLCILLQYSHTYCQNLSPQDFSSPTTVKEELFGFNGGFMMEVCGATTDSIYVGMPLPLEDYHLLESCADFTNKLNPNVLRFPGGTGANYYHFNGNGYGFQFWEVIGSKFEGMVGADARLPENHIENFADLCLQSGTKVIYVLNLLTHYKSGGKGLNDPTSEIYNSKLQENLAAIDYLKSRGVEVLGVELGNEVYAYFEINGSPGTRNQYMNLSRVYTDSIKQRYPNMQVGMPIMPTASLIDIYFNEWNKMVKYASFVDAYILHSYETNVMHFCSDDLNKEEYFECAKIKIDDYIDAALENNLNFFWTFYGRSKQIWLTEWNILNPQRVGNTFLQSYFIQKHWNKLMELEKKYPGDIGFTNCHNFISGGYLYPSVGYQQPNESASTVIVDQFALRASYYPNLMMSNVLKTGNKFIGRTSISGCEAWLYKSPSGKYDLVINNSKEENKVIDASIINDIITENDDHLGFTSYSSLSANNLYDACGINFYNLDQTNVVNELSFVENEPIENTSILNLNGLSISVVRIESTEETPPFSITNYSIAQNECEITMSWSSLNDRDGISYVIYENNLSLDTINSLGENSTNDYSYLFIPDSNKIYTFKLKVFENGNSLKSPQESSVIIDCIPLPEPFVASTQLNINEDCEITYSWQVENQMETHTYVIATTFNAQTVFDTIENALSTNYTYFYFPKENGDYSFQVNILEEGLFVNSSEAEVLTVDCIEVPEATIIATQINSNEGCQILYSWSVENQAATNSYIVTTTFGSNTTLDTVSFYASDNYDYLFPTEENGEYSFQITILNDNELVSIHDEEVFTLDCFETPEPNITFSQLVLDDNCNIIYTWRVENQTENTNFIIATTIGNVTTLDTIASSLASLYSYSYIPEENGEYSFQIALLDGDVFLSATSADLITVDCIVLPPIITTFSAVKNADCSYTVNWMVINEQIGSSYQLHSDINGSGFSPINMQYAFGNFPVYTYSHTFYPDVNGTFDFQLKQFMNGNQISITDMNAITITCAPLPDPILESFRVNEESDCVFKVEWTVSGELSASSYKLFARRNNSSLKQIYFLNGTEENTLASYSYDFIPELNGSYVFEIEQYNEGELVTTASYAVNINCVANPDPLITDYMINDNGDCTFNISWSTINELPTSSYTVFVNLDNDSLESIQTIVSIGSADTTDYQFTYTPNMNGVYEIVIQQFNEGVLIANPVSTPINITCILPPDPIASNFTTQSNADCSYQFSWDISGELLTSVYKGYVSIDGGEFSVFETIISTKEVSDTSYIMNYTPQTNGSYIFKFEQYNNGALVISHVLPSMSVTCIPAPEPFIENFTVTNNGDCTYEIKWAVSNEIASTSYELLFAIDGNTMETIYATPSNGELNISNYSYTFVPDENSIYDFQVVQLDNNEFLSSSTIETAIVQCIEIPVPLLNSFTVESYDDCTVDLSWDIENQNENTLFVINESFDGGSYSAKDAVNGNAGSSTQTFNYSVPVNEAGEYSYNLEIYQNETYVTTSFDESTIVYCPQNVSVSISANPIITFGSFTTNITTNQPLEGELKITNAFTGFRVLKEDITLEEGVNSLDYDFDNMPGCYSGLYVITFQYNGGFKSTSIIYF